MAVWLTWLENAIFVCHPDTIKDILKASHTIAIKGSAYRLLHPMIGKILVLDVRKPGIAACEQHRSRSACTSVQSDQRLW